MGQVFFGCRGGKNTTNSRFGRWLNDPLLHFTVIGLVLFAGYTLMKRSTAVGEDSQRIMVGATEIQWLHQNWEARWQRPPTEAELRGLVDDYVRQEVLYRGAMAMGLDRNDSVIRQRMVQKIKFMTEDLAGQAQPTETELQSYFQENADKYRIPERRGFAHIFFDIDRRGDDGVGAAERLLTELQLTPMSAVRPEELGDRFMLEHEYSPESQRVVSRQFGERFAAALFDVTQGEWQGPIASGYGLHLVRVSEVWESKAPELSTVRDEVLLDYAQVIRERATEAMFSTLANEYVIDIDEDAILAMPLSKAPQGERR